MPSLTPDKSAALTPDKDTGLESAGLSAGRPNMGGIDVEVAEVEVDAAFRSGMKIGGQELVIARTGDALAIENAPFRGIGRMPMYRGGEVGSQGFTEIENGRSVSALPEEQPAATAQELKSGSFTQAEHGGEVSLGSTRLVRWTGAQEEFPEPASLAA